MGICASWHKEEYQPPIDPTNALYRLEIVFAGSFLLLYVDF